MNSPTPNSTSDKKANHQLYFDLHSWIGITCGLLLFIVCFSGVPAIFEHEISYWQFPAYEKVTEELAQASNSNTHDDHIPFDLDRVMQTASANGFNYSEFFVGPAHEEHPLHRLMYFGEEDFDQLFIHPLTYEIVEHNGSEVGHVLTHLHTDLHLPRPFGRYLVGLSGMVLLIMLIAGVLLHKKWKREAISVRPKRSLRLQLVDHHKLIGLWTLPFTVILTFTGTILGLLGIIAPILALAKFDGNVEKATEAVVGPKAVISGEPANHKPLNPIVELYKKEQPESSIEFIQITGWDDKNAVIQFSGFHQTALSNIQSATFSLNNGELIHKADSTQQGVFQRLFAAVTPLHYVLFGDIALKFFYAISALALCLLILTGNIMWLVRQEYSSQHWLSKLTLGVSGGLVISTLGILAAVPLLQAMKQKGLIVGELEFYEELCFFGIWLIGIILPWVLAKVQLTAQIRVFLRCSILFGLLAIFLDSMLSIPLWDKSSIGLIVPIFIAMLILLIGYFDFRLKKIMHIEAS